MAKENNKYTSLSDVEMLRSLANDPDNKELLLELILRQLAKKSAIEASPRQLLIRLAALGDPRAANLLSLLQIKADSPAGSRQEIKIAPAPIPAVLLPSEVPTAQSTETGETGKRENGSIADADTGLYGQVMAIEKDYDEWESDPDNPRMSEIMGRLDKLMDSLEERGPLDLSNAEEAKVDASLRKLLPILAMYHINQGDEKRGDKIIEIGALKTSSPVLGFKYGQKFVVQGKYDRDVMEKVAVPCLEKGLEDSNTRLLARIWLIDALINTQGLLARNKERISKLIEEGLIYLKEDGPVSETALLILGLRGDYHAKIQDYNGALQEYGKAIIALSNYKDKADEYGLDKGTVDEIVQFTRRKMRDAKILKGK